MALSLESNKSGTAQVKSGDWATLVLSMCPVTPQMVRASSGPAGQCKVTTVGPPTAVYVHTVPGSISFWNKLLSNMYRIAGMFVGGKVGRIAHDSPN